MTLIGYARSATPEGLLEAQIAALEAAGCEHVFSETAPSAPSERPQLAARLDSLRPGDTLILARLDRLSRIPSHMGAILDQLYGTGADLRTLDGTVNITTPEGRLALRLVTSPALPSEAAVQRWTERLKKGARGPRTMSMGTHEGRWTS